MNKLTTGVLLSVMLAAAPLLSFAQVGTTTPMTPRLVAPEFKLTADGIILVRGLLVTDLAPNMIRATFMYGNFQLPVVIQTTPGTSYWNRTASQQLTVNDLRIGDTISFSGIVTAGQGAAPAVIASVVRDWTPAAVPGRVGGDTGSGTGTGGGAGTSVPSVIMPNDRGTSTRSTGTAEDQNRATSSLDNNSGNASGSTSTGNTNNNRSDFDDSVL